jgi:hypothetical protein
MHGSSKPVQHVTAEGVALGQFRERSLLGEGNFQAAVFLARTHSSASSRLRKTRIPCSPKPSRSISTCGSFQMHGQYSLTDDGSVGERGTLSPIPVPRMETSGHLTPKFFINSGSWGLRRFSSTEASGGKNSHHSHQGRHQENKIN